MTARRLDITNLNAPIVNAVFPSRSAVFGFEAKPHASNRHGRDTPFPGQNHSHAISAGLRAIGENPEIRGLKRVRAISNSYADRPFLQKGMPATGPSPTLRLPGPASNSMRAHSLAVPRGIPIAFAGCGFRPGRVRSLRLGRALVRCAEPGKAHPQE